jgi:putative membrane protein
MPEDVAMLKWLLLRLLITAAAFAVAAWLIPSFEVKGGFFTYLWVALIFGVVNAILGPILQLISLPLTILTLGLFALVVNGVVLTVVAGLSDKLDVGGFGWSIVAALVISVVSALLGFVSRATFARSA